MRPEQQQAGFAAALTDPSAPLPDGIVDPAGRPAPKRFATYRNNVTVSLIEALRSMFPAVEALIGAEPFRDLARAYLRAHPPTSPVLAQYGDGFADFIGRDPRLDRLAFLPDVARLERAWLDAYHEADAQPLDPATLGEVAEEQWPEVRFVAHPAARLVRSSFPVVDLWTAAKSGNAAAGIDPGREQWALVVRPEYEVSILAVPAHSGPVVQALLEGQPISAAVGQALDPERFDFGQLMGQLLASGAFLDVEIPR